MRADEARSAGDQHVMVTHVICRVRPVGNGNHSAAPDDAVSIPAAGSAHEPVNGLLLKSRETPARPRPTTTCAMRAARSRPDTICKEERCPTQEKVPAGAAPSAGQTLCLPDAPRRDGDE